MNEDKEIFISYTGKSQDRQSIGVHSMPPDQIRCAAVALYVDARQCQEDAGYEMATAQVWIGTKWLEPSVAEVDAYQDRVEAILAREREMRAAHVDEPDDEDEPPTREESEEVPLTEDDFAAVARDDESSDKSEEPPLVDLIGLDMGFDSGSDLEI